MYGGELWLHGTVPVDGALDQLREKSDKQQKFCEILFSRVAAAVAVDQIPDSLKRVKADAQRQDKPQRGRRGSRQSPRKDAGKVRPVLKITQYKKVGY